MEASRRELLMATTARSGPTQPLWFIDHLVHVQVDGDTSGGALALLDERGRRGDMPPLHVHRRDDETFYVLEGEVTLFVAGEQIVLGPGQASSQRRPTGW
jgi:mannose-6-phosphate isomerase-like protein (cupin superfamily)